METWILSRESDTIFGQGTMLKPSTPHIGKGVALGARAAAPVYPRVYRRPTISDSRNDHSLFMLSRTIAEVGKDREYRKGRRMLYLVVSDRIRRLALQNTGCTTEYGTASVDRSLTVPTGA